jgi:DNA-binding transcriptional MerR regulator
MSDVNVDITELGQEPAAPDVAPEILAEAQEQGWVPFEQWVHKPEEWCDAETFVRRGREINPLLRKALKEERKKTAALEAELRNTGATVAELREYLAKVEERATKNALAQLKAQRREALSQGDQVAADDIEQQMDELKSSASAVPKAPPAPQPQQIHPEVAAWMGDNPWYSDDNPEMQEYANGVAMSLMARRNAAGQQFTPKDILPEVTAKVRKMFPKHFSRGEEAPAAMFESGGSASGSARSASSPRGASAFDKLPAEARAQFKRFYDAGYYVDLKTRKPLDVKAAQAEYLKEYE